MEATEGGTRARQSSPVFPTDRPQERYSQLEIDRMVGVCKKKELDGDGQGVVYLDSSSESGGKAAVMCVRKISGTNNLPDITRLVNNHNQEPIEEHLARIQRLEILADLGPAKLVYEGVSERVCGSPSYQDPVSLGNGQPCDKDDVYSFGEVLLELITGKPACEPNRRWFFKQWVYLHREKLKMLSRLRQVVDKRMDPSKVNWDQVYKVAKIARDCLQKRQKDRPSMKDVVFRLRNTTSEKMATSPKLRSIRVPCGQFGSNGGCYDASNNSTPIDSCFPTCDKEWNSVTVGRSDKQWNSLTVGCTVAGRRITVRCKIWPTSKSLGFNEVEAKLGTKLAWKHCLWMSEHGLWVWNRESRREIEIGDNMKVTAEWHVTVKSQGPFCIKYLSIKDEKGTPLVFFNRDERPHLQPTAAIVQQLPWTDSGEVDLGEVIGRGGYGTVREGKWRDLDVAVKHFKCREAEDLVKIEGVMLKRLEHSKVVKLYACAIYRANSNKGDIEGMLVMERMDHDLRALIEQRRAQSSEDPPFTLRAGLNIISQIAEGMRHLKLCRVLHRDLRASNVLVKLKPGTASEIDTCYKVKLSDFGLSKFNCSSSFFTTKEVGALQWRAPEVFKDQDASMITKYTWSSDVYSFGMTCFEILTGEVPFPRKRAEELYKIICSDERPTLPQNSPPDLVKLIEECWLTDPMKRPNFDDICRRLSLLKEEFLKTS